MSSCKRPCAICRRWFFPDARIGKRQRACSKSCGAELRKKTQKRWRDKNADYAIARQIAERALSPTAPPARMPAPLCRLPWDLAKDEFGGQGADFIGAFGRLLLGAAKDEIRVQTSDIAKNFDGLLRRRPKDEIGPMSG